MSDQEKKEDEVKAESSSQEETKKTTKKTKKKPIRQTEKSKKADIVIGTTVSLNFAKRAVFGSDSVMLTPNAPTAVVPEGISEKEQTIIARALASGVLVRGETPGPGAKKRVQVLDKYIDALKAARTVNRDLHPVINKLARKREDGKYTIHEILEHMLQYEVEHENRQAFVEYLNYAMSKIPGPTGVTWTPPSAKNNDTSSPAAPPSEGYTSSAKEML